MSTTLKWKRNVFTGNCTIYSGEVKIGKIKRINWRQSRVGSLYENKYRFKVNGIMKPTVDVIDEDDGGKIGEITFNFFKIRATFDYLGETFEFQYTNIWKTHWKLVPRTCLMFPSQILMNLLKSTSTILARRESNDERTPSHQSVQERL